MTDTNNEHQNKDTKFQRGRLEPDELGRHSSVAYPQEFWDELYEELIKPEARQPTKSPPT